MTLPSELDLAHLIVNTLSLSVSPTDIDPQGPLFGDGLGLDSIDGLEIGMAVKKTYGVTIDGTEVKLAFHSLTALKNYISNKMQQVQ